MAEYVYNFPFSARVYIQPTMHCFFCSLCIAGSDHVYTLSELSQSSLGSGVSTSLAVSLVGIRVQASVNPLKWSVLPRRSLQSSRKCNPPQNEPYLRGEPSRVLRSEHHRPKYTLNKPSQSSYGSGARTSLSVSLVGIRVLVRVNLPSEFYKGTVLEDGRTILNSLQDASGVKETAVW